MTDLLMPRPQGPVRFSHLKAYGKSALHGYHARTADDSEQSQAMERGTAVHALLFETRRVTGYPGKVRRGKEFDAFVAANPDTEILTMPDYDRARRMADAVRQHTLAWPLLQGVREETLLFRWNGLNCRSTPDVRGAEFITELKSGATCAPGRFEWHAVKKMSYHAQMRMEALACERAGPKRAPLDHYIVAVEQSAPFPVQVYRLDERALEAGERSLILWSERLKVAEDSGQYPAYSQTILPIDLPEEEEGGEDLDLVFGALPATRGDALQQEHGLQP